MYNKPNLLNLSNSQETNPKLVRTQPNPIWAFPNPFQPESIWKESESISNESESIWRESKTESIWGFWELQASWIRIHLRIRIHWWIHLTENGGFWKVQAANPNPNPNPLCGSVIPIPSTVRYVHKWRASYFGKICVSTNINTVRRGPFINDVFGILRRFCGWSVHRWRHLWTYLTVVRQGIPS